MKDRKSIKCLNREKFRYRSFAFHPLDQLLRCGTLDRHERRLCSFSLAEIFFGR